MAEEIYTVEETARRLKVSEQTVRVWIRQHQLRAFKISRNWRISATSLAEMLGNTEGQASLCPAVGPVKETTAADRQAAEAGAGG